MDFPGLLWVLLATSSVSATTCRDVHIFARMLITTVQNMYTVIDGLLSNQEVISISSGPDFDEEWPKFEQKVLIELNNLNYKDKISIKLFFYKKNYLKNT